MQHGALLPRLCALRLNRGAGADCSWRERALQRDTALEYILAPTPTFS